MVPKIKLLARFSALQGLVQLVSAVSGFTLVRVLDKSEYAVYTIATSTQVILNLLSDGGVGSGLNALGGRVWQKRDALSGLVASAFAVRLRLAWVTMPFAVSVSLWLFRRNSVPWLMALSLISALLIGLSGTWTASIYAVALRLHSRYLAVQKAELLAALFRLALIVGLATAFLNSLLAVLIFVVSVALEAMLLARYAEAVLDHGAPVDEQHRTDLSELVRKQAFQVFFYAFQGQITLGLISIFGTVEKVADLGALARLGLLFALVGSIITNLLAPTLARCDSLARLRRLVGIALASYAVFGWLLMMISLYFPGSILWLIGPRYSTLTAELPWLMATGVLGGFTAIIHSLAFGRGWIWHAWLIPVLTILAQMGLLSVVDVSSLRGVLIFGFMSAVPNFMGVMYMALRGFRTTSIVPASR
jgi:hypothetical protein